LRCGRLSSQRDLFVSGTGLKVNLMMSALHQELNDTIDMSCARYIDGSTLLCHDDELEGRRIAYILYLVPKDWKEEDGYA
jgi:Rps23 Pro-64 3,4-dihydroxylase Tpa1-like proline 4-hydroxylase